MEIFSNQHKWQQKERAAANTELSRSVDYLRDEVASRLCERILVSMPLCHAVRLRNH
jgi:NADH dehydrogenase [ubiquinone] 1 alpha subcomplex assembly factor 5